MALFDLIDIAKSLHRIANSLEIMTTHLTGRNQSQADDRLEESAILYHDDAESERAELIKEAYFLRTGRRLGDGERPPRPPVEPEQSKERVL